MYLVFHGPLFFYPHANYPRTADDQNVTPGTKAHSTAEHNMRICSAQAALGIIKSLFAPNHGPLLFAPFIFLFFIAFFLALRERSGQCQLPAERSPCRILQVPTTQLAKMSIDPKSVGLTADILEIFVQNPRSAKKNGFAGPSAC